MPIFDDLIADFFQGDNLSVVRSVTAVPTGDSLAESWMTVKEDPVRDTDAEAVFQKHIVPADNPGVGQITDTGATDHVGAVRFDLVPAETVLLKADVSYSFDIQHLTAAGLHYTSHAGTIRARQQVTRS